MTDFNTAGTAAMPIKTLGVSVDIDCDRDEVTAWQVAQCLAEANTVGSSPTPSTSRSTWK